MKWTEAHWKWSNGKGKNTKTRMSDVKTCLKLLWGINELKVQPNMWVTHMQMKQ